MTGLCDRCFDPGACCRRFALYDVDGDERTFWLVGEGTVDDFLESRRLPFLAEQTGRYRDPEANREYGSFVFSCPALGEDGRCTMYRRRPDVCRNFEPANGSPLCVHSFGAEGTGDGL